MYEAHKMAYELSGTKILICIVYMHLRNFAYCA